MRYFAPFLAALALAGVADALPPAPEVAVLIYAPWGADGSFNEALLARVAPDDGSGGLRLTEPVFTTADFAGCEVAGVNPEACIRGVLAARNAAAIDGPPTVVLLVRPAPGFDAGWTCVGVGEGPTREDRQRSPGIERTPGSEDRNAQAAAGCLLAAASESGW